MADAGGGSNNGTGGNNANNTAGGADSHAAAAATASSSSPGLRAAAPSFQLTPSQAIRSQSTGGRSNGGASTGNPATDPAGPARNRSDGNRDRRSGEGGGGTTTDGAGRPSLNRGTNGSQSGQPTAPGDPQQQQQQQQHQEPRRLGPSYMAKYKNDDATGDSPQAASGDQPRARNNGKRTQDAARRREKKGGGGGKKAPSKEEKLVEDGAESRPVARNNPRNNHGSNINKKRNNKPKKKYPWRRFIPKDTVDPITLESLQSLDYPPFALCADEPWVPVPVWPIPEEANDNEASNSKPSVEELNRQRLAEQWGSALLPNAEADPNADEADPKRPSVPLSERPFNLYDGRALAYYLVSQLQFIDPLNRRDLTRPELVNLDRYLTRLGFTDVHVTEAYDAKGVTLSTAGAAATTAQGRADIMQQMAQQLLNSLFSGQSVSSMTGRGGSGSDAATTTSMRRQQAESFSLQEQYAAMQRQEQARHYQSQQEDTSARRGFGEAAFYGSAEDGGFIIIDDDENPGMRGGSFPALNASGGRDFPSLNGGGGTSGLNMYSASHIADRYGEGTRTVEAVAFPALAPAPAAPSNASAAKASSTSADDHANDSSAAKRQPPKASKTLSKISGIVKKTSQDEKQRQWEAREAARRKAMMSNLSFGVDPSMAGRPQGLLVPPQATHNPVVSEEQLQRNRAFAEALGVKPATQRHYNSGWSRPTDGLDSFDEYGNELEAAMYSEALVAVARERMPLLVKLEKKWKTFLADDKAASLPLNPMDKPSRAFVHHYSDFWNLKTESFDPEPKRYIHCVKLIETRMPYPLLSDVALNWRGPLPDVSKINLSDHASQQTAGQTSKSRELPPPPDRVPLPLKPRSMSPPGAERQYRPAVTEKGGAGLVEANAPHAARSNALLGRERPKLDLAPRTVPLGLPPYDPHQEHDLDAAAAYDAAEDLRRKEARIAERRQREREAQAKKRQVLEKAFASDDEEEERGNRVGGGGGGQDSDSEWGDEPEAVYTGSDNEED